MMLGNQLNPGAEVLMQQVLGHKHAFPQNYFLFFPAPHISLQGSSTTKRKNPDAQAEQECRFQMCLCTSGHIIRPSRGGTLELLQATLPTHPGVKLHSFALRKSIPELLTFNASFFIPYTGKLNI